MLESWCVSLLFTFVSQNIQLVFRERERERELVLGLVTGGDSLGFELLQSEREICVGLQFAWFQFWGVYYLSIWIFFKAYLHKAGKITNKNYFLILSTPLYV